METFTGAEKPAPGRISTLPTILGYKRGRQHRHASSLDGATVRVFTGDAREASEKAKPTKVAEMPG
jgi:hypothetical protein